MHNTPSQRCPQHWWLTPSVTLALSAALEFFCWGFTVDDAWIVTRVAANGASTGSFAFNPGGPATDAVTPYGFAHLLALLGSASGRVGASDLFSLARILGLLCFGASMAFAAWAAERIARRSLLRFAPILAGVSVPAALWAGAGLSTPIVGLALVLGAWGLASERGPLGGILLGFAGGWRPELLPTLLALVLLCDRRWTSRDSLLRLGLLILPCAGVACARWVHFGSLLPLSSVAKAPDLGHGVKYALVTLIWGGLPGLALILGGASGLWEGWRLRLVVGVHLASLCLAGGDWMPGMRLSAPLYPLLVFVVAARLRTGLGSFSLLAATALAPLWLLTVQGEDFRAVVSRREALVAGSKAFLNDAQSVAAVDIGWLGIASDASIVDLAGVTDRKIAELPGGHTSKRVGSGLFSVRKVDTWVMRSRNRAHQPGDALSTLAPSYFVDERLRRRALEREWTSFAVLPLPGTPGQYVFLRYVGSESGSVQ